jgi:hypothetical protein
MRNELEKPRMTVAERSELAKLVRLRSKVAKNEVMATIAVRLAQFEAQVATRYDKFDEHWAALSLEADKKIEQLDGELAKRCEALGIPARFRPQLEVSWYHRGENASKERRAELRRVAESKLQAQAMRAKADIERREVDLITQIVQEGLDSERAKAFLDAMPTVNQLMPELALNAVEKILPVAQSE